MRRTILIVASSVLLCLTSAASAAPGHGGGHGGGGGGGGGTKTITVSMSSAAVGVSEDGDDGLVVTITRSGSNLKCTTAVAINSVDNSATAGSDFVQLAGQAVFQKGQTSTAYFIDLMNDTVPEGTEDFDITLSSPSSTCKGSSTVLATASEKVTVSDHDVVLNVPNGGTVSVVQATLGGCNTIAATLHTPTVDIPLADNAGNECSSQAVPDTSWVNDTGSDTAVTLLLQDNTCLSRFSSDTTSIDAGNNPSDVNHALVVNPFGGLYTVDIADGWDCTHQFRVPAQFDGNFTGMVVIEDPTPQPKFSIPGGYRAVIDAQLSSCNTLSLDAVTGNQASGTTATPLISNEGSECSLVDSDPDGFTVDNTGSTPLPLVLRLTDVSCASSEYNSDGTGSADHAFQSGSDPVAVDITDADAAPDCLNATVDDVPAAGGGDLQATVSYEPIPAPAGYFNVLPGERAAVEMSLGGCNELQAYVVGTDHLGDSVLYLPYLSCSPDATSFNLDNTGSGVLVYGFALFDLSCSTDYFSDGTGDADHAHMEGTGPITVDIGDAGGACERAYTDDEALVGDGNLSVSVTIGPIPT
jgi:hypothetical protein